MVTKTRTRAVLNYGGHEHKAGQAALDAYMFNAPLTSSFNIVDSFSGVDNRNWKHQIRNGMNATTPASGYRGTRDGRSLRYFVKGYVNGNTALVNARSSSFEFFTLTVPNDGITAAQRLSVINQARTKFSRDVEKALTNFQGGVFLAELRETLHMIRRPGQSLRKAVGQYLGAVQSNARRLKRRPKRDRERWLSNTWLEYSFGWAPLLNDLDDARSYLDKRASALVQELVRVRGSHSGRFKAAGPETLNVFNAGIGGVSARELTVDTCTQVYSGAVSSRAFGPGLINASAMGLHPRSFVPTLWEVIPWSFLIDYFTNVGDVITGWSNQHAQLAWGRETIVEWRETTFIDQRGNPSGAVTKVLEESFIASNMKASAKTFSRGPITYAPAPGLSFEIPGMGTKWINMAALVGARRSISSIGLWR